MVMLMPVQTVSRRTVTALLVIATTWPLSAAPIDLNDFFADPSVTVAPDGSSATLSEDPLLGAVLLSNDPGLGDPNVILPSPGALLSFQFDFVEAAGHNDEFGVFVIDATTGLSAGAAFEFFTQVSSAGTIAFDLTTLVGRTLGLQFQLSALPSDPGVGSQVRVSNASLDPIPEPTTAILLGSALALIALKRRSMRRDA